MGKVLSNSIYYLLALIIFISASCSSSKTLEPESDKDQDAKEIKAKTKSSLDLPELELFSNAKRQYQSGLYSISRDSFSAIKDNYPTGPFAEFSELKIADSHFENRDYQSAALAYDEFTKNRPASSALPYALLRSGRSYELSSSGVGRDPTPLHKALESYASLIDRFPNSVYTSAGRYYKRGVEELLASYEQQVINFYEEKNKTRAKDVRDREFQKKYGSLSSEFEAGSYDKKASLAVGPTSEDKLINAKQILQKLPPVNMTQPSLQDSPKTERAALPDGKFLVAAVSCDPHEKLVVLSLEPKPQNAIAGLEANKHGDAIEIHIAELTTVGEETKSYTCFSEGDLTISSSGLLTLRGEAQSATALYVENPARVILTLN